uniref:Granulocyte colony-stimulating factor n=2 Tax=Lates calcarifer TaxID=8187 RepID=A0A4W6EW41_LATCA
TDTETERHTAALNMNTLTAVALLHCFLFAVLVRSAPVGPASEPPAAFKEAAERAKTLVEKILRDLPAVHAATVTTEGLTLDPSTETTNLQLMVTSLGIPAAPVLKPLSERFTLDMCVSRMMAGGQLYQGLLGVLSERLSGLKDLRADLRDLLTHINKMKVAAQVSSDSPDQNQRLDLASRLHGNYEVQVGVHLTLTQLRSFCHDLIRSLRAIATYRPRSAGTR